MRLKLRRLAYAERASSVGASLMKPGRKRGRILHYNNVGLQGLAPISVNEDRDHHRP